MTGGSVKGEISAGFPASAVVVNGSTFVVVVVTRCGKGGKVCGPFPRFPQFRFCELFREPAFVHDRQFSVDLAPMRYRHRPFFGRLKCGKIQSFQQGCVAWEYAALTVQPAICGIQASMALVVYITVRTSPENLKIGLIESQLSYHRFMARG